jgi:hypothetical protein
MLIATFGPTTGWVGKKITRDRDAFVLEGHGVITAKDVMEYDRQGHLVWVNDVTRASVAAAASAQQESRAAAPASTLLASVTMAAKAVPLPGGLEGMSSGDWVVVAGSVVVFFGSLTSAVTALATLAAIAAIAVVVLSAGVIPGVRYEMGGRVPLIIISLGGLALLLVLAGMSGMWGIGGPDQGVFALVGSVAVIVGGFMKARQPVAASPSAAFTDGRATVEPQVGIAASPAVASPTSGPATASLSADPVVQTPVVTPSASAATHSSVGVADEIAKLADLHAKGSLTDEEFASLKAKLTT